MNRTRVSAEQRQVLFDFMVSHEDLARGRVAGPDAARLKKRLLEELACELNALGSGATKTPEKWLKCWQDWKSDVKQKALKIKKHTAGTGGGPGPAPLTSLENDLMHFYGIEIVEGLPVPDPLQESDVIISPPPQFDVDIEVENVRPETFDLEPPRQKTKNDPLHEILSQQVAAIESLAIGVNKMAEGLLSIAAALQQQQQVVVATVTDEDA